MRIIRNLFLANRFFVVLGALILVMTMSYPFPWLLPVAKTGILLFAVVGVVEVILLFNKRIVIAVVRDTGPVLSLGDDNAVVMSVSNRSGQKIWVEVIDELPEQLQIRSFSLRFCLDPGATQGRTYNVRPLSRGEYGFGDIHVFLNTRIGLLRRRITHAAKANVPVYPSIIQMRKYELKTFAKTAREYGIRKVRRIGHSYEFEHIKPYHRGDDYRSINWKATGRRAQLMVNQYEDERSQPVYTIIDMSRVMYMPFGGLSLFDYAVNASLVISNIVLGKQDKAGLITFAERPRTTLRAQRSSKQLKAILEALYKEKEAPLEANFESLYMAVRNLVSGRSLLFLYTNFESTYSLERVLPQLQKLNKQHLLVVVFFENTEINTRTSTVAANLEEVYTQITAENYALTKIQIAQQLRHAGIVSILTRPEHLTVSTINKYLELKSRGMI